MGMRRLVPHADGSSRPYEADGSIRQQILTFDEHPEEVGQVEVMQEDDDNARALVGLADVDLSEAKHFRQFTALQVQSSSESGRSSSAASTCSPLYLQQP